MSTKDTTEVAGEFTIQVPTLDTTLLSPCPVVPVVPGSLLSCFSPRIALGSALCPGQRPKPFLLIPSREQPPPEDLPPKEAVGVSSSVPTAASRAAALEYK